MNSRREFLAACGAAVAWRTLLSAQPFTLPDDLAAANRILATEGILDGMGHVSARTGEGADRFLLARSMAPQLVTVADVMDYRLDGEPVNPQGRSSYQERFIHSEIYRARPDVEAIVHCHTPSLIPFAASSVPMRAMYHMAAFVAEGVPVFDIRQAAGVTDLLVKTPALGAALAKALGPRPAVLMRGHGAVIVATSIPNVVGRSIYLDLNARAQMQALALGGQVTYVGADEAKLRMQDPNEYSRAWDLWKRKVGNVP